jgi:uncharacterized protein (UPF0548 family)
VSAELAARALTYAPVGATAPRDELWTPPGGPRAYERTVSLGHGEACWQIASTAVVSWGVKTRSGFAVRPPVRVAEGRDFWLIASVGPVRVREPVRVVAVVDEPDRCGFAYGTLEGHPVSGEEAFVVHRTSDGDVRLTLRSLTGASSGPWRAAFPFLLLAQRWYRHRYLRAL